MDLHGILRSRIDALPEGDYMQGLKAILQHIEVAGRHLERGRTDADETAFTDAIYRTNQAFEGSLKEAFRVLAAKDPDMKKPFDIEVYLQKENILRPRVLSQFTNYRKNWRNPSTHDYRLDFDEDEALLAIVTVSAFAIVLIDQITERISFENAATIAAQHPTPTPLTNSLLEKMSDFIRHFVLQFKQSHRDKVDIREVEITGALAGFLFANAPDLTVQTEPNLVRKGNIRPDCLITSGDERLILEVKRGRQFDRQMREDAIQQVARYMRVGRIGQAILFVFTSMKTQNIKIEPPIQLESGRLVIISTE